MTSRAPMPVTGPPATAVDLLLARQAAHAQGEIVRFTADGSALTASQAAQAAAAVAGGLRGGRWALPRQAAVATCLRPGPALVEIMFGVAAAGLVEVPLSPEAPGRLIDQLLVRAEVQLLLLGLSALASNAALASVADRWAAAGRPVAVADDRPGAGSVLGAWSLGYPVDGAIALPEVLAHAEPWDLESRRPLPGSPAVVMATSGTTGSAKAALLPHFAGVRQARRVAHSMGYGPDDVLLNFFPWNHINVRHAGLLAALVSGARLVVAPTFTAARFWEVCRAEAVTAFNFMGAVAEILLRQEPGGHDRLHLVTRAYGGPAPAGMVGAFRERFGVTLLEAYACTELADVTANTLTDHRPGTAGRVLPEYEVRLRDDAGLPVPPGSAGHVTVRPRHRDIAFLGYLGDPAATAEVRQADGWVRTGDRASIDGDGYFRFAGRRADVIRRRGENVSAAELQRTLAGMDGVAEVVVAGVDSPLTEQEILAVVMPVQGRRLSAAQVHAWCTGQLPRWALPRFIRVVGSIPRNAALKPDLATMTSPSFLAGADEFDPPRRTAQVLATSRDDQVSR